MVLLCNMMYYSINFILAAICLLQRLSVCYTKHTRKNPYSARRPSKVSSRREYSRVTFRRRRGVPHMPPPPAPPDGRCALRRLVQMGGGRAGTPHVLFKMGATRRGGGVALLRYALAGAAMRSEGKRKRSAWGYQHTRQVPYQASWVVGGLRSGVLGINPRINYIQEQHIQDKPDRTHRINPNARCSASVGHRFSVRHTRAHSASQACSARANGLGGKRRALTAPLRKNQSALSTSK